MNDTMASLLLSQYWITDQILEYKNVPSIGRSIVIGRNRQLQSIADDRKLLLHLDNKHDSSDDDDDEYRL